MDVSHLNLQNVFSVNDLLKGAEIKLFMAGLRPDGLDERTSTWEVRTMFKLVYIDPTRFSRD